MAMHPGARKRRPAKPRTTSTESELKTLRIDGTLHGLLKQKAASEGRILQRMVEDKLRELVAPAALQFEAALV